MSSLDLSVRRANDLLSVDVDDFEVLRPGDPGPAIRCSLDVVVHLAVDEATRSRLDLERRRLEWATVHGVPVPEVVAHTDGVLVTARHADTGDLRDAIPALLAALDRLAAAPPPPEGAAATTTERGLVRRLITLMRAARWSVLPWQVVVARRAVAALPSRVPCHHDLSRDNVLVDGEDVVFVDLELAGNGPAGWDLARLVPTVDDPRTGDLLVGHLADRVGHEDAATLLCWSAIRHVTDLVEAGAERDLVAGAARRRRELASLVSGSRSAAPRGA